MPEKRKEKKTDSAMLLGYAPSGKKKKNRTLNRLFTPCTSPNCPDYFGQRVLR
jgi:hypothetical protein